MRRMIAAVALAAFLPLGTVGCFGRFELVRKVYKFNQEVSPDKWMQEFAFLVLTIVPIYSLASFLDAILLNSIEFWTGENPALSDSRSFDSPEGHVTLTKVDADTIAVEVQRLDGSTDRLSLTREDAGFAARDAEGRLLAHVAADAAGAPRLVGGSLY